MNWIFSYLCFEYRRLHRMKLFLWYLVFEIQSEWVYKVNLSLLHCFQFDQIQVCDQFCRIHRVYIQCIQGMEQLVDTATILGP